MVFGPDHTDNHKNSPSDYGTRVRSTLQTHNYLRDSKNCVSKTNVGDYYAYSKSYNNGRVTDTVRADQFGETNCHNTGVNNDAHQAFYSSIYGPLLGGGKSGH
jgi:hypothetical protein